jgi:hypothetical protein
MFRTVAALFAVAIAVSGASAKSGGSLRGYNDTYARYDINGNYPDGRSVQLAASAVSIPTRGLSTGRRTIGGAD